MYPDFVDQHIYVLLIINRKSEVEPGFRFKGQKIYYNKILYGTKLSTITGEKCNFGRPMSPSFTFQGWMLTSYLWLTCLCLLDLSFLRFVMLFIMHLPTDNFKKCFTPSILQVR